MPVRGHLCGVYGDEREWAHMATAFVREGLAFGQRIAYYTDTHSRQSVVEVLREHGVDVDAAMGRGQLLVEEAAASYLRRLPFDPDVVLAGMRGAYEQALAEGFPGLRIVGEMDWCTRDVPGADRILEYELRLEREVFADLPLTGLCFFDDASAADAALVVAAHRQFVPPTGAGPAGLGLTVNVAPDSRDVRLHGHADLDTRSSFAVVLRNVARMPGPVVHLDLAALDFLDVDALAQLVSTTVTLRETGRRLVLQSPPASLIRAAAMFPDECDVLEIAA
ncbi:MEDS domain-containing protein [Streptomyces sp. NPDC006733]|uniref:MEDS domain-containing protein n=1 Tax=Streptomyces sp. NPDC006733 TaxID=3155460 RepID=UPI0033C9B243